jgi:hypothetical protein
MGRLARMSLALFAIVLIAVAAGLALEGSGDGGGDSATPHLYWGATIGSQLTGEEAPWDMTTVTKFEEMTQKPLSLIQFFQPFAECEGSSCSFYDFPTTPMESIREHGSIPVLSWSSQSIPSSLDEPNFQLSDLIEGRYDSYITEFARAAAAWGHPFFLRFDWEMNGNWLPWSESVNGNAPGQYIAAWRHVHDIFTSVGATNATWAWCPYADEKHRFQSLRSVYPGSAYVDWTCMDGYNWGKNAVNPQKWRTFPELFKTTYERLTKKIAPHKPIMIAEFASTPNGGHKAAWIRKMFAELPRQFPRIRGLIWFDSIDRGVDWPLETSATATKAFAEGISRGIYASNRFADLPPDKIPPLPSR